MLKIFAIRKLKNNWSIAHVYSIEIIFLLSLFLDSCIIPVPYGPYYHPIYHGESHDFRINREDEAGAPSVLSIFKNGYRITLNALSDDEYFALKIDTIKLLNFDNQPLILEDVDSGSRMSISVLRRTYILGLSFDIRQKVDPVSLIPGFAAVPASERRYTLSIDLEWKFDGNLPEMFSIQLPNILIGDRLIEPPKLILQRNKYRYLPVSGNEVTDLISEGEFGTLYHPLIWHEEKSLYRLAAGFYTSPIYRENEEKEITGRIYVEVIGDAQILLTDEKVALKVPEYNIEELLSIENSNWNLEMYTTNISSLDEQDSHLWNGSVRKSTAVNRCYYVLIPNYQPKRFRVILPRLFIDGHEYSIDPIEFEYRIGGVGFGSL